jgi:N-acetylmuramoyl-L-alanine amidase
VNRRLANVLVIAVLLVASGAFVSAVWRVASPDVSATQTADPLVYIDTLLGPVGAVTILPGNSGDPPGYVRISPPRVPDGPRRVGIQVGHWMTDNVPPELTRLETQTGASWDGINEVDVNLDIAQRVAALLQSKGLAVDVLPTTVPAGYVADAVVALHADSDGVGDVSGFKMAHGRRRSLYEDQLLNDVQAEYAAATGLDYDGSRITTSMTNYYLFAWNRFRSSTSPFTPSVILEMGYLSNDGDRALMINKADVVATGIANGILRFLGEVPSTAIFGKDLVLPPTRAFPIPTETATTRP